MVNLVRTLSSDLYILKSFFWLVGTNCSWSFVTSRNCLSYAFLWLLTQLWGLVFPPMHSQWETWGEPFLVDDICACKSSSLNSSFHLLNLERSLGSICFSFSVLWPRKCCQAVRWTVRGLTLHASLKNHSPALPSAPRLMIVVLYILSKFLVVYNIKAILVTVNPSCVKMEVLTIFLFN